MTLRKMLFPIAMALCGLLINATGGFAKVEYTKKEKKGCVHCHVSAKSKELNPTGKCYEEKGHSLDGCPAPPKKGN